MLVGELKHLSMWQVGVHVMKVLKARLQQVLFFTKYKVLLGY